MLRGMKVAACMTTQLHTIQPGASLAEAARLMWEHDLGVLPVVDAQGLLVGMLTDRDVCMAAFTSGAPLHVLVVGKHMATTVFALMPDDSLKVAHERMRMHQLRRLPVVDAQGQLVGMLTLMDLARRAGKGGLPVARVHEILTRVGEARTATTPSEPIREVKAAPKPAAKPAPKAKASPARATKSAKKSSNGSRRALVKQR